jgi:hypothetical protein
VDGGMLLKWTLQHRFWKLVLRLNDFTLESSGFHDDYYGLPGTVTITVSISWPKESSIQLRSAGWLLS